MPTINVLADTVRSAGGTVAWVVPGFEEATPRRVEFYGPAIAELYGSSGGAGAPLGRLWHELRPDRDDVVVEKTAAIAFFPGRCELHSVLHDRGVDMVLVCGTVANVCCESTARDAATLGYRVVMVADANARNWA